MATASTPVSRETLSIDSLSSDDRKIIVDALELKHASLLRAARAESDAVIAERRMSSAQICLGLIAKFR